MAYETSVLCTLPTGPLPNGEVLNENSGFVDSRKHAGVFWVIEDSASVATPNANVYAIGYDGTHRKTIRLAGASNAAGGPPLYGQWEDIGYHAASNTIWVANSGNGGLTESEFWVYSFTEPDSLANPGTVTDVPITAQYRMRWPDAPVGGVGWNCECVLVRPSGRLFFVNKAAAADTGLYAAPEPDQLSTTTANVLQKVASWTSQGNITGGDWASDGHAIYVSAGGNTRGFKYRAAPPWDLLEEFVLPVPLGLNPEALAVTRDNRFLLRGAEGDGSQVLRVTLPVVAPPVAERTKIEWWISETERLDFTPTPPAPDLVVPGGSFEDASDLALWTKTGGPANILSRADTLTAAHGTWYATLEVQSAGTVQNLDSAPIDITALDVIPELTMRARWVTGGPYNVRLDYRFFSDTGGTVPVSTVVGSGTVTTTDSWTEILHPSVPKPAGAVSMRVRATALQSPASGSVVAYDAIGIEVTDPVDPGEDVALERARLRAEIMAPVNDADAAVQRGDFSSFTTVTTFAALRSALMAGQRVRVDSTINCTGQILVATGAALYVGPNGKVLRNYASSGATTQALIRTANLTGGTGYYNDTVPSHNLFFGGPGEIGSSSTANTGNIFGLAGDNIVFDGFTTRQWNGGRHTCWIGDNGRVRRIRLLGGQAAGSGNGGLRYMGGTGFRVIDSECDSGDDVWQCVPAGALNDPFFAVTIDDAIYFNCTGSSASGRLCIIGNQDQNDNGVSTMHNDITNVQFIDITGVAGGSAIAIQNKSSDGTIANITYKRVKTDGSLATTGQPGAIFLNVVSAAQGPISNVNFIDVEVLNHHRPALRYGPASPQKVNGVHFTRGRLERGTQQLSEQIIEVKGTDFTMEGTILFRRGSTSPVVSDLATDAPSDINYVLVG